MAHPLFLRGRAVDAVARLSVSDKLTGEHAFDVSAAGLAELEVALEAAWGARRRMAELASFERRDILAHLAVRLGERRDEIAQVLAVEGGKPVSAGRGEVERACDTCRIASEEATRIGGELLPLDVTARTRDHWGAFRRVPVGVVACITPFNFPVNLVAHKIAPAIAAGCPFVVKPASTTPRSALILGELLAETRLPPEAWSILPCGREVAAALVEDPRVAFLSFTGSAEVGWGLRAKAGKKRVALELGGNAAVIVEPDADLDDAAARITLGAFYQAGQSCISVQRIYAHERVVAALVEKLVERARAIGSGDPRRDDTVVGPLISSHDAERILRWIAEAVHAGARLLTGGTRNGNVVAPTLLDRVPCASPLLREEAFGPVAVVAPYRDFEEALELVNDSRFGLQAGLFTRDIHKIERAWRELDVGGVIVNDTSSFRADVMPYGGVKDSGLGREGLRFAIEEMTEPRMLVVRRA